MKYVCALTNNNEVGPSCELLPIVTRQLLSALQYSLVGTASDRWKYKSSRSAYSLTGMGKVIRKSSGPLEAFASVRAQSASFSSTAHKTDLT